MLNKLKTLYYEVRYSNYGLCSACYNYFGISDNKPYSKCKTCDWFKIDGYVGVDNWQPKR